MAKKNQNNLFLEDLFREEPTEDFTKYTDPETGEVYEEEAMFFKSEKTKGKVYFCINKKTGNFISITKESWGWSLSFGRHFHSSEGEESYEEEIKRRKYTMEQINRDVFFKFYEQYVDSLGDFLENKPRESYFNFWESIKLETKTLYSNEK